MKKLEVKAKRKDNNDWVKGYYVWFERSNGHYIYCNEKSSTIAYEVLSETICRNTDLQDSKGNELWEHDIVKNITMYEEYGELYYSEVVFVVDDGMWKLKEKLDFNGKHVTECELAGVTKYTERIGSKFDFPGLLEE